MLALIRAFVYFPHIVFFCAFAIECILFLDWLDIEQDHKIRLPILGGSACQYLEIDPDTRQPTGVCSDLYQPAFMHRGSHCDSLRIKINGSSIRVSGNPSRWGRVDNLFGFETVDQCVAVFNAVLLELGLPPFTRCTQRHQLTRMKDDESPRVISDGAVIRELHLTSNRAVGAGNVQPYLMGLSTQHYRNSMPRLLTDGNTVDWLSKNGRADLIYACVYDKAFDLQRNSHKIKNRFGDKSVEYQYLLQLILYCQNHGVCRFEQKLKKRFLERNGLQFWGLSDYSFLNTVHDEFLAIDEKLQVTAMTTENILQQLVKSGVCTNTKSAMTTAFYAHQWMHGEQFDFNKSQVQTHRARLRKIGIDIADKFDSSKFCQIKVIKTREVVVRDLPVPKYYIPARVPGLRLVA